MPSLVKGRGSTLLLSLGVENYITSVLVFNLCLVLFVQVNENDVLLLCDARKKNSSETSKMFLGLCLFHVVSLSSIFFPPAFLLSPAPQAQLYADGLISCNGRLFGDNSAKEAGQPPKIK